MPIAVDPAKRDAERARTELTMLDFELGRSEYTNGRTLGFALAKGLIRGLTRCPNPSSKTLLYFPFLDVS